MKHLAIAGLLIGCSGGPLPSNPDAGLTCSDIPAATQSWLDAHTSCNADGDCTWITTGCGLPDQCGVAANTAANGDYLASLLATWSKENCVTQCAKCPAGPAPVVGCSAARCVQR